MDTDIQSIAMYYGKLKENYDIWKDDYTIKDILYENSLTNTLKVHHPYMDNVELSSLILAIYIFMHNYVLTI